MCCVMCFVNPELCTVQFRVCVCYVLRVSVRRYPPVRTLSRNCWDQDLLLAGDWSWVQFFKNQSNEMQFGIHLCVLT
jgi:hypothetical protein